ncbi:MAG TPA: HD domain-containing phosphohydrolase [Methylomirabilota bacterium]|jgi:HD-GYP domain-containing protein (c-di-GMP phosphodiesterase class II)|nr:HD domain-containing phosphohydrolase [Methylomirabilota bacterium]
MSEPAGGDAPGRGGGEPGTLPGQAAVERLIAQVAGALTTGALYPPAHPAVAAAIGQLRDGVVAACDARRQDALTFLRLDDEIVIDGRPLRSGALYLQPFIRALRRSDVARLTLGRDLDEGECRALVDALAAGRRPESTPHAVVGQVEIASPAGAPVVPPDESTGDRGGRGGISEAHVELARDLFTRIRHEGVTSIDPVEELVWGLADAVARSTQAVLPTVPLKSHDEYTFVHSVNVSLLVLAQARGFGFEGPLLHAIGVAALLHDVGKLRVPLEVLNKAGKLSGDEWTMMASHAELGAWELGALANSAPLSILVAYEHHLRYDGEPNYPALRTSRTPTLASQLTAIADVYDAICTVRPYRRALSQAAALEVLRSRVGTFHDPYLVGQFCHLVTSG